MQGKHNVTFVVLTSLATACASVTQPPIATANLGLGNTYVFRGVPQATDGVLQGDVKLSVTDEVGSTYAVSTWANLNLSDEGADGVFPGGQGGKITEFDVVPEYSHRFGAWALAVGLVSYNFPNGVGASTTEVYAAASVETLLNPKLTVYYDFEEVDGAYVNAAVAHDWRVSDKATVDMGLSVGFADARQGAAYWGDESSGWADLVGRVGASYTLSDHVALTGAVYGSSILANEYRDALSANGLARDSAWLLVGANWSF